MPKKESKQSSSSSSSSESEDDLVKQQLKEATVSFDQIASAQIKSIQKTNSENKKSKRFVDETQNDDDDDSFKLTPEFQEFVAKKLRSKLDESIELVEIPRKKKKHKKSKKNDSDFELVKGTSCNTDIEAENTRSDESLRENSKKIKKSMKKSKVSSDSEEDLTMFKEAAVDSKFILESSAIENHRNKNKFI